MPPSDANPAGVDPAHVWAIATAAAPRGRTGLAVLVGRYPARVRLPSRAAAQAVQAALQRVGYQAGQPAGPHRGRDVVVAGWSAQGLESRLTAMRTVLHTLAAEPGATAAAALDPLGRLPAASLPGWVGRRLLVVQAGQQLRAWISATSGTHAPYDPRALPADPGCALRLNAARRAEEAIDDLVRRHLQVAEFATALYPGQRQRLTHDAACASVIRRAEITFHLGRPIGQDLAPLPPAASQSPGPSTSQSPAPPGVTPGARGAAAPGAAPGARDAEAPDPPGPRSGTRSRPGARIAQEFPAAGQPASPRPGPPPAPGTSRPRGRNFPSGRARRRL